MSELSEPVHLGLIHGPDPECPFCPVDRTPRSVTSRIGKDNASRTLGANLEGSEDHKVDHLYFDVDYEIYRRYSAEAHHLICGNEVLKEEGEIETFLVKQGTTTSKGAAGKLEPNDVGYDVNHANNGIWLPSVPDMFRRTQGQRPARWWGDQARWNGKYPKRPARVSLEDWEKADAAFIVMEAAKRQFHKGEHGSVGEPHNNYVEEAIRRVRRLTIVCQAYSKVCPMEAGEPKKDPPFVPPYRLIGMLDDVSRGLGRELTGSPETWNFYISEFALRCSQFWKREIAR